MEQHTNSLAETPTLLSLAEHLKRSVHSQGREKVKDARERKARISQASSLTNRRTLGSLLRNYRYYYPHIV
jgi:hypothetical protein